MTARRGPLARAVAAALRAAPPSARDRAGVELARWYATLIDDAAPAARYADVLATLRAGLNGGDDTRAAYEKVAQALAAHSVASDLGPKLLAALAALQMTPAARKAEGGKPRDPVRERLDELRARRDRRGAGQHPAAAVDTSAS